MKLVISPEIPEMLAGHEGYLTQNYRNYPQKQALEEYLKAVNMVTFELPQDVREMQTKFEKELAENIQLVKGIVIENQQLKQEVNGVKGENQQLKEEMAKMKEEHEQMKKDHEKVLAINDFIHEIMITQSELKGFMDNHSNKVKTSKAPR